MGQKVVNGIEHQLNSMQYYCQTGDHDAVCELFQKLSDQRNPRIQTISHEIYAYDRFQFGKRQHSDNVLEHGRHLDQKALTYAAREGQPRAILLRCINIIRSHADTHPKLAAEALMAAYALRFAAVGVGEDQLAFIQSSERAVPKDVRRHEDALINKPPRERTAFILDLMQAR